MQVIMSLLWYAVQANEFSIFIHDNFSKAVFVHPSLSYTLLPQHWKTMQALYTQYIYMQNHLYLKHLISTAWLHIPFIQAAAAAPDIQPSQCLVAQKRSQLQQYMYGFMEKLLCQTQSVFLNIAGLVTCRTQKDKGTVKKNMVTRT